MVGCWRGKRPWKGDNSHLSPPCFYLFIYFAKLKSSVTDIANPPCTLLLSVCFFSLRIFFFQRYCHVTVSSSVIQETCCCLLRTIINQRLLNNCWIFIVTLTVARWATELKWNLFLNFFFLFFIARPSKVWFQTLEGRCIIVELEHTLYFFSSEGKKRGHFKVTQVNNVSVTFASRRGDSRQLRFLHWHVTRAARWLSCSRHAAHRQERDWLSAGINHSHLSTCAAPSDKACPSAREKLQKETKNSERILSM